MQAAMKSQENDRQRKVRAAVLVKDYATFFGEFQRTSVKYDTISGACLPMFLSFGDTEKGSLSLKVTNV